MNHPLTDEMCEKIQLHIFNQTDADCMRAAADWQLEQVLRFMEENGFGIRKILLLKDAMRPQQQEES